MNIRNTAICTAIVACGTAGCSKESPSPAPAPAPSPTAAVDAVPAAPRTIVFEETAQQAGIDFVHDSGHRDRFYFPECVCGGAALFDMDNDGDLDAYLVQSRPLVASDAGLTETAAPRNQLYRNRGDGTFENVTAGSGADDPGYGNGVATGDYDNDGDLDLYIMNLGPNVLLRNDGDGRFTDVSKEARVDHPAWGISGVFYDADNDGDLDLFTANYITWTAASERDCTSHGRPDYCEPIGYKAPARDLLYRNNGDGTFTDVTTAVGLGAAFGNGMGVAPGDFDDNGLIDLFVANDQMANQLWMANPDGTYTDASLTAGVAFDREGHAKAGMGVAATDVDLDGDLDLLVVNLNGQSDSYFRNDGAYFADRTTHIGLGTVSRMFTRFGVGWRDFNNDGFLDLFEANGRVRRESKQWSDDDPYAEPNVLCLGNADGRFVEVAPRSGTAEPVIATSRGAAFGDVDNDGRIDILIANRDGRAHLLRNIAETDGHWVMLSVLTEHGGPALGAVVTLTVGDKTIRRDVTTASSYASASDPRVHIGLGEATSVSTVTVRWPDGTQEQFDAPPIDQITTLNRGTGR